MSSVLHHYSDPAMLKSYLGSNFSPPFFNLLLLAQSEAKNLLRVCLTEGGGGARLGTCGRGNELLLTFCQSAS